MEIKYIVAIVAGSVFLLLFLVFLILHAQSVNKQKLQRQRLEQMYADKNLVKMYYDFLVYDEETEKIIYTAMMERSSQLSINEIDPDAVPVSQGAIFQTVDTDGIEEIVGTYRPD